MSIFSIIFILLCAWRALLALALKRSTNFWWCAISSSRFVDLLLLALAVRRPCAHEGRVVAGVERHRLVVHVQDVGGDVVQEAVVVRDDDAGPL